MNANFHFTNNSTEVNVYYNNFERFKIYGFDLPINYIEDEISTIESTVFIALGGRFLTMNLGCYKMEEKGVYFVNVEKEITNFSGIKLNTALENEIQQVIQQEISHMYLDFGLTFFGAADIGGTYWSINLVKKLTKFILISLIEKSVSLEEVHKLLNFRTPKPII